MRGSNLFRLFYGPTRLHQGKEQGPGRTPDGVQIDTGTTISLSGDSTTEEVRWASAWEACLCWCNCSVDRPFAHNCPVLKSRWWGKHDCKPTVPSRPSEPMLATTSIISQLRPGKSIVMSNSPRTVNGEESAETIWRPHGRSRDCTRGSVTHIFSNTDVTRIVTWHPVSIINSTSIPTAHPIRNHGAAEPTAPTTIAFPLSCGNSGISVHSSGRVSMLSTRRCWSPSRLLGSPVLRTGRLTEGRPARSPAPGHTNGFNSITTSDGFPFVSSPCKTWELEGPAGLHRWRHSQHQTTDPLRQQAGAVHKHRPPGAAPRRQRLKTNPQQWPDIPLQQRPGTVSRQSRPGLRSQQKRPGTPPWHRSIIQFKGLPGHVPRRYGVPVSFLLIRSLRPARGLTYGRRG